MAASFEFAPMPDKPATAKPGKPPRRRFQFRLRTLLTGVMLAAVVCYSALTSSIALSPAGFTPRFQEPRGRAKIALHTTFSHWRGLAVTASFLAIR